MVTESISVVVREWGGDGRRGGRDELPWATRKLQVELHGHYMNCDSFMVIFIRQNGSDCTL